MPLSSRETRNDLSRTQPSFKARLSLAAGRGSSCFASAFDVLLWGGMTAEYPEIRRRIKAVMMRSNLEQEDAQQKMEAEAETNFGGSRSANCHPQNSATKEAARSGLLD